MFCAPGDKQRRIVEHGGDDCADRPANVPLLIEIAVVQHGVRAAANSSVTLSLAFDEHGSNAARLRCWNLRCRRKPEVSREGSYASNVERVQHTAMGNCQWPGPSAAETCQDNLVHTHFDSRRNAGHR